MRGTNSEAIPGTSNKVLMILLGLMLLAAYANSFTAGLIVDNKLLILQDPRVQSLSWENLQTIFTRDYWWPSAVVGVYRPVAKLTYLFNFVLPGGGTNPIGYHVVNILLQWGNMVLVFLLLKHLLKERAPAFFGAALFGLHPIATEAVTNIIGRTDLLAGGAIVGALLCFIRGTELTGWRKATWLAMMSLATGLGMLTKENAVGTAGVIVLYAVAFLPSPRWWRESLIAGAALVPAYAGVWVLRNWVAAQGMPPQFPFVDNPLVAADFLTARLTALKVISHYCLLLIWPARLSCDYSYNQIPLGDWTDPGVWAGIIIVGSILTALVFWFRRNPAAFFLAGSACLLMLPTSNLPFTIGNIMGERYLYASLVGFAGCIALGLSRFPLRYWRYLGAVVLVAAGIRSFVRNFDWKDNLSIWSSAAQSCPNSAKAQKAFASALHENDPEFKSWDKTMAAAARAVTIMEQTPLPVALQYGGLYADLGSYFVEQAERFRGATNGTLSTTLYRKGITLLSQAVSVEEATAAELLKQAIRLNRPTEGLLNGFGDYHIYGNLGVALMRLGENDQSLAAFDRMHRLAPNEPKGYLGAALAYENVGDKESAVVCLLQALLLDTANQSTWKNLFDTYSRLGMAGQALIQTEGRPKLNMQSPLVRHQLRLAYEKLARDFDAAGNHTMAVQLRRQSETETSR